MATHSGHARTFERKRHYVPTELRLMMRSSGFEVRGIWGGAAGERARQQRDCDEIEAMVSATRVGPSVL